MDIEGKKLLILGGIRLSNNIIESCKKQGVYSIVIDYLPDSPAKKNADEHYLVSITDVDEVVKLAKKLEVDGIFTNYMDSMMEYCARAAKELNLPYYATEEQIEVIIDKSKFKECCKKNDVLTTPEFSYRKDSMDYLDFDYPVIVKPVDSSGGKGISVCKSSDDFPEAYRKALEFSKRKEIIVEKYLVGDEICSYYVVQKGEVSFAGICDRYTCHEEYDVAQVPTAYIYPSKYIDGYIKNADANIKKMIKSMGIQNGVLFFQGFADEDYVYLYEMAFRFAGAQEYRILRANSGYDLMDMMVHHALTGEMGLPKLSELADPYFKNAACKLTPLLKTGIIQEIEGLDEVLKMKEVTDVVNVHEEGDVIDKPGTLEQVLTRIFIKASNLNTLADVIDRIYDTIHVYDVNGNDMLFGRFDTNILRSENK
ncbi:MAG: ATP-grasp domain-containing protein [Lachnospiraceae bacterium]